MDVVMQYLSAVGIIAAIIFGVSAIRTSNTMRTAELIAEIYDAFLEDTLFRFYTRIRNKDSINWQQVDSSDERLLNKSLTLFDKIDYLLSQGLLHKMARRRPSQAWEFFSSEIQYFAANESVWDYMVKRIREGLASGFPKDIVPFTGFRELLDNIPETFRARPFPYIPEKYRAFFDNLDSSQS